MEHNHIENCIFCKIIKKEIPAHQFLENEHAIAILDAFPVSKGHSLILSKSHYDNLALTKTEVLNKMMELTKQTSLMLENKIKEIKGFNYLSNQNSIAKQSVFHTHIHVIPKYSEDTGFVFQEKRSSDVAYDKDELVKILKK